MNDLAGLPIAASELAAAAYIADVLFGGFRWGVPAAPRWLVMLVLLAAGEISSFLIMLLLEHPWTGTHVGEHIIIGLAAASGVWARRRIDLVADKRANGTAPVASTLPEP